MWCNAKYGEARALSSAGVRCDALAEFRSAQVMPCWFCLAMVMICSVMALLAVVRSG
jgi:hypothetical protein